MGSRLRSSRREMRMARRPRRSWTGPLVAALLVGATQFGAPATAAADGAVTPASFEGAVIDMSGDWGEATACAVWEQRGIRACFRTERELDAYLAALPLPADRGGIGEDGFASRNVQCSSSVRLYDATGYGGTVLQLLDRYQWLNLSSYGFSNRTSSYKIGACSSYFADYSNGGGSWYPTSATQAWDQSYSMNSGWNNRVSSVYIT